MESTRLLSLDRHSWQSPLQHSHLKFFAHYMLFISVVLLLAVVWFRWVYHIHLPERVFWLWLPLQFLSTFVLYRALPRLTNASQARILGLFILSLGWLGGFLYDTGGAINPLIHLLIAPIAIGMVIFSRLPAFTLILATTALYFLLNQFYVPIMSLKIPSLNAFFDWHLSGSAAVFLGISILIMMIVFPLKQQLEAQQRDLIDNQKQALRHEYLLALGTFAASSAHRLGTPLNTLSLLESSLRQHTQSPEQLQDLDIMADQLAVCQQTLSNIRQKADQTIASQPMQQDLDSLIQTLKTEFTLLHPTHELKVECPNTAQPLFWDDSLSLALQNLLENAARYSPDTVELHCQETEQAWVFQVYDQGRGVPETLLPLLGKQPIQHADGEGIGLYLTQMIIERYQGQLAFENQHPGTCATLTLPKPAPQGKTL